MYRKNKTWALEDKQFAIDNKGLLTYKQIANKLGVSHESVTWFFRKNKKLESLESEGLNSIQLQIDWNKLHNILVYLSKFKFSINMKEDEELGWIKINKLEVFQLNNNSIHSNICGVYIIRNLTNKKFLIGCSEDIQKRILGHLNQLKSNKHGNSFIQKDWDLQSSKDSFVYSVIQECNKDELLTIEDKYLKYYQRNPLLYNQNFENEEPLGISPNNFWNKVNIINEQDCWLWKGQKRKGYGVVSYREGKRAKTYTAHRIAYYLHYNKYPNGWIVMHTCNNKLCCNPHHLELGTNRDNIRQAIKDKLRQPRLSTKTIADVEQIYKLLQEGKGYDKIDKITGLESWVLLHRTKNLSDGPNPFYNDVNIRKRFSPSLDKDEINRIYKDRLLGLTAKELKVKYGRDVRGLLKRRGLWVELPKKLKVKKELQNTINVEGFDKIPVSIYNDFHKKIKVPKVKLKKESKTGRQRISPEKANQMWLEYQTGTKHGWLDIFYHCNSKRVFNGEIKMSNGEYFKPPKDIADEKSLDSTFV